MGTEMALSRKYRLGPMDNTLTRAELVERLRLLWQGSAQPAALGEALEVVLDALGLTAERAEILGETTWPSIQPGEKP